MSISHHSHSKLRLCLSIFTFSITIPIDIHRSAQLLVVISAQITANSLPSPVRTRTFQKGRTAHLLVALITPVDPSVVVILRIPIDVLTLQARKYALLDATHHIVQPAVQAWRGKAYVGFHAALRYGAVRTNATKQEEGAQKGPDAAPTGGISESLGGLGKDRHVVRGRAFAALTAVDNLHSFVAATSILFCILVVQTSPLGRGKGHEGRYISNRTRLNSTADSMVSGIQCLGGSGILNPLVFHVRANVDVANKDNGLD